MDLDFCRVELEQRTYEPEQGQFTWDSLEMLILYRILDWCERRHVDVFPQEMWGNVDWNAWPEFRGDGVKRVHSGPNSIPELPCGDAAKRICGISPVSSNPAAANDGGNQ